MLASQDILLLFPHHGNHGMDGRTFKAGALEEHRFIRNGNRDVLNSGIFIPDRFSICIPSRHCDDVVLGQR